MQIFKRITLFICLNLIAIFILQFALTQPSQRRIIFNEIHEKDYSTIVVGQSHAETGIDPYILSEGDNSQAYNLARRLTPINDFVHIIKEANRDSKVEKVYVEIDSSYWYPGCTKLVIGTDANLLLNLSWRNKIGYVLDVLAKQNYNDALCDYYINFLELNKIPKNIKTKMNKNYIMCSEDAVEYINESMGLGASYDYIGRGFRYGKEKNDMPYSALYTFDEANINDELKKIFNNICKYCEKEDIELICFTSALPPYRLINENHDDVHNFFMSMCENNNVNFIDLNYVKSEYLSRSDDDYVDIDGHMMGPLAQRQTRILKEISNSNNPEQYFYDTYDEVLEGLKVKNGDAA